jgi:hypothetical protein
MFQPDFTMQPIGTAFKPQIWLALGALLAAVLVLTAIAIAASTRLGQIMTLCVTVGIFILGMLSDWTFGRPLAAMGEDWTQRVKSMDDKQLQALLKPDDLEAVREWVRTLYTEHADRTYSVWHCSFTNEMHSRPDIRKLPSIEKQSRISGLESEAGVKARQQLTDDLAAANNRANSIIWPPTKNDLVHELDWPITFERTHQGECETVTNSRTFVYPPLQGATASRQEHLVQAAYRVAASIVPNFQVLWLSDAITQEHKIPLRYLGTSMMYALLQIIAALSLAVLLFQSREVG